VGATRSHVLFMSSNGAGVGHLMRLMAMARRSSADVEPIFLTLSQSVSVVRQLGFPVEYLMSPEYLRLEHRVYNALLARRVEVVVRRYAVRTLVFDGAMPYAGLLWAKKRVPGCAFVWSRRAMWQEGIGEMNLERSAEFDRVIEPGDFAESADRGLTVGDRARALRVHPFRFLDDEELLEREEAMAGLGLDPHRPAVLVQLGAGNIDDATSVVGMAIRALLRTPDVQICVTRSIIAERSPTLPAQVVQIQAYPLARFARAFDFAITAAGYNSFQESVAYALPTILVPNKQTKLDDQVSRARWAAAQGAALVVEDPDDERMGAAVATLLRASERATIQERCAALSRPNGAPAAIAEIERIVRERAGS
jgi:UDP:flavonoid glycosyltransferase YjiC (YdhE family)